MPIEITHVRTHNGKSSKWKKMQLELQYDYQLETVRKSLKAEHACKFVDFCYICKV